MNTLNDIIESIVTGIFDLVFSILLSSFDTIVLPILQGLFGVA